MDNLTSRCKYEVVLFFALLCYNVSMAYASATRKEKKKRPNLFFIMTDQQRFDALSFAENKILKHAIFKSKEQ